jgi:ketosteroid isomerase-like protein
MSQENVELVRRGIEAWNGRDLDTLTELWHADGEFLLPRNLFEGGSYRGHDWRRALEDATESWDEARYEVEEVRDLGNRVLVLGRAVNVGKNAGPRVEYALAWVYTVRDGKVSTGQPYLDRQEALEAVGLSE